MSRSTDGTRVLILGGGPAGAAAAITLARAGREVTLFEREPSPRHKVCGEFLSVEALGLLQHLGIDLTAHDAPFIHSVRLIAGHRLTQTELPFPARSLTRRCLDSLLLDAAAAAGVSVLRGHTVEALASAGSGWQVTLHNGAIATASQVVLASGKHDLRGLPRPRGSQGDLVALKMYFHLSPAQAAALRGAVELHLHAYGYTGLQQVESGRANLCALVRRAHLAQLGGWQGLLNELCATNFHAAERLREATPLLEKPLAISSIPYGFVRREAIAPGLYAVGDQAAVIPSFTGDGMSVALYSGVRAATALLSAEPAAVFQVDLFRELRWQVARATALSRALVSPTTRPLLTVAASWWPAALRHVARLTRLSSNAVPNTRRQF